MSSISRIAMLCSLSIVAFPSSPAEASPITFQATASVSPSGAIAQLVPAGTQGTMVFTIDYANGCPVNGCSGNVGGPVPNSGFYTLNGTLDFLGYHYLIYANLLVNWGLPGAQPGLIDVYGAGSQGPHIGPYSVSPNNNFGYFIGGADPQSGALPNPLVYTHWMEFSGGGRLLVTGSNPQAVPEPSTWLLFGTGLVALAARRRLSKRTGA